MHHQSVKLPPEKAGLLAVDTELKDPEDQSPIRSPTVSKTLAVQNEVIFDASWSITALPADDVRHRLN